MQSRPAPILLLHTTVLTVLAGFLDATAYAELNHLYVSFMSGNSTHLGLSLGASNFQGAIAVMMIVAAFVLGAALGSFLADHFAAEPLRAILKVEVVLLGTATLLSLGGATHIALVVVTASMGLQNAMHQVVAGADVGKSFITGILFNLGRSLSQLFSRKGNMRQLAATAFSWVAFVSGATLGALAVGAFGLDICLAAATATMLTMLVGVLTGWI